MSIGDIKTVLDITNGLVTPLLIYIAWLIWRIYANHLPHVQRSIDSVDKRLARLEGRQEERDQTSRRIIEHIDKEEEWIEKIDNAIGKG